MSFTYFIPIPILIVNTINSIFEFLNLTSKYTINSHLPPCTKLLIVKCDGLVDHEVNNKTHIVMFMDEIFK